MKQLTAHESSHAVAAYVIAAVWSSSVLCDESDEPVEASDYPATMQLLGALERECGALWDALTAEQRREVGGESTDVIQLFFHKLALDMRGHGSGLWDGDIPLRLVDGVAERLKELKTEIEFNSYFYLENGQLGYFTPLDKGETEEQ